MNNNFPIDFLQWFERDFVSPYEEIAYNTLKWFFPDILHNVNFFRREMDLFIPSLRLNIEIDWCHHDLGKNFKEDTLRDRLLEKRGIRILRINTDTLKNIEDFKEELKCELQRILH